MIPHKRIERLMELYDVYCRTKDPDARLFLVGSISEVPEYYTYLEEYRKKLLKGWKKAVSRARDWAREEDGER